MNEIMIETEFVTLGQFLKMTDIISSGGQAKWYLEDNDVLVNDELETRRGRKLRKGDIINIPDEGNFIITADNVAFEEE